MCLEENLAAIPDCAKSAVNGCQGTLTNLNYQIDTNGNISVAISGTNDPDGKIARENAERKVKENREKEARIEKKHEEQKETEERLEKQRAEKQEEQQYNLKVDGKDVTDLKGKLVELLGTFTSIGVMESGDPTFDALA